jgi:hypothetical protein
LVHGTQQSNSLSQRGDACAANRGRRNRTDVQVHTLYKEKWVATTLLQLVELTPESLPHERSVEVKNTLSLDQCVATNVEVSDRQSGNLNRGSERVEKIAYPASTLKDVDLDLHAFGHRTQNTPKGVQQP